MKMIDRILELNDHSMIYALQTELNRERGSFNLDNQEESLGSYNIFESEFKELIRAVQVEDYLKLRGGIGGVVTTILALAFLIDMDISYKQLKDVYLDEYLYPCEDYRCYVDTIYKAATDLKTSILKKDIDLIKRNVIGVLACTYLSVPEFARFSIHDDLVQITKASLSKICTTEEDAQITVAKYAEEGCLAHYKRTPSGRFAIYSSKEQLFRGKTISGNKVLEFHEWQRPVFEEITNEATRWNHYKANEFKALQLLEESVAA